MRTSTKWPVRKCGHTTHTCPCINPQTYACVYSSLENIEIIEPSISRIPVIEHNLCVFPSQVDGGSSPVWVPGGWRVAEDGEEMVETASVSLFFFFSPAPLFVRPLCFFEKKPGDERLLLFFSFSSPSPVVRRPSWFCLLCFLLFLRLLPCVLSFPQFVAPFFFSLFFSSQPLGSPPYSSRFVSGFILP